MKGMIAKKISVVFVISTLVITSLGVVLNNDDVLATPDPENIAIDYQLIYDVTRNLSERIMKSYDIAHGELAKGRDFGSPGEHDAAEYIAGIMYNLSLFDPDLDPYCDKPYHQQIKDIQDNHFNDSLEILWRKLTLHNTNTTETTNITDFYISPEWGKASFPILCRTFDKNQLTKNYSYTNLQIGPYPLINWSFMYDFFTDILTQGFFENLTENITLNKENTFDEYLTSLFEVYYNFTFEDILEHPENATELPWYNETLFDCTNDYVFFDENPNFNPNISATPNLDKILERPIINAILSVFGYDDFEINELQSWILFIKKTEQKIQTKIMKCLPRCKALLRYDYHNDSFNTAPNRDMAVPIVYINGSLGHQINQSRGDYRIDIQFNQSWNDSVESYNVIGQINGSDPNKTVIIECLYDSVWSSGNGGTLNTSGFTSGYNTIKLNDLRWINKTGITQLCLRSSKDISGIAPTGSEYVNVHSNEFLGMCPPKLVINYRNQSKIKNAGSTDIKGYLLVQIQFYNSTQGKWLLDDDTINETTTRTITSGNQLALDTIFNGHIRASELTHGTGTYRVYTAFRDPEGNILRTDDDVDLEAWWQFNKT